MLVVVGGHSRNIGKTSVAAALIAALPEAEWTAVKITQFGHGICTAAGKRCDCGTAPEHPYSITEETRPSRADTGRFVAAGAKRCYWVRTAQGHLAAALAALQEILASSRNSIVESNSLLEFVRPDLYLFVADLGKTDFKPSARRYLERADALVIVAPERSGPVWNEVEDALRASKRRFRVHPPSYTSEELTEFVRSGLSRSGSRFAPQDDFRTEREIF